MYIKSQDGILTPCALKTGNFCLQPELRRLGPPRLLLLLLLPLCLRLSLLLLPFSLMLLFCKRFWWRLLRLFLPGVRRQQRLIRGSKALVFGITLSWGHRVLGLGFYGQCISGRVGACGIGSPISAVAASTEPAIVESVVGALRGIWVRGLRGVTRQTGDASAEPGAVLSGRSSWRSPRGCVACLFILYRCAVIHDSRLRYG